MKKIELNFKRKRTKREIIGMVLIVLAILFGCAYFGIQYYLNSTSSGPSPVGKQYPGRPISKSETVYVDTDSNGEAYSAVVDTLLRNNTGSGSINDKTSLTDIVNVNGNEKFTDNGDGTVTWDAKGRNMFYEGVGNPSEIPVKMNVKYKLDGKPIAADEIDGKSGDLEIEVSYENKTSVDMNGTEEKVPFAVVSAIVVNDDSLYKLKVSSGTVIEQGKLKIAVGVAVPGMAEAIDVEGIDDELGNTVVFKGTAKRLKSNEIITVISSDSVDKVSNSLLKTLDMDSKVNKLDKATKQLVDGTGQLNDGTAKLKARLPEYTNGVAMATDANRQITDATEMALEKIKDATEKLSTLATGIKMVTEGIGLIVYDNEDNTGTLATSNDQIREMAEINEQILRMQEEIVQLKATANTLEESEAKTSLLNQIDQLSRDVEALQVKQVKLQADAQSINDDLVIVNTLINTGQTKDMSSDVYEKLLEQYIEDMGLDKELLEQMKREDGTYMSLVDVMELWIDGEGQVTEGVRGALEDKDSLIYYMKQLNSGMNKLNKGSKELTKGADALNKGTNKLNKGMNQYYSTGIKKIVDMYDSYLKGMSKKLKKLKAAGKEYNNFSGLSKGMTGTVKFVYFTPIGED